MRTRRIPMTFEEFEMLPRKLGFKHEYLDGQAWISPGHGTVVLTVPVEQRPIPAPFRPRPVAESDAPALGATFVKAFADAVEFCDFSADRIRKSARESIEGFFSGARGRPLPASRLCEGEGGVEGAALLLRTCHGTALDLLFVRPARQRLGLGTALVASASNELAAAGEEKLLSQHHLGNEASTEWHRRFGFVEEPDLMISQQRLRCARHELRRREKLGGLTAGERGRLRAECGRLTGLVAELEAVRKRDGFEAVSAVSRFGFLKTGLRPRERGGGETPDSRYGSRPSAVERPAAPSSATVSTVTRSPPPHRQEQSVHLSDDADGVPIRGGVAFPGAGDRFAGKDEGLVTGQPVARCEKEHHALLDVLRQSPSSPGPPDNPGRK